MNQGLLLEERLQDVCMQERTLGLGWRCDEQVMVTKEGKENAVHISSMEVL